ncbi:hypothetical protein Hypma_002840 [Hypsizygus marmoreus]|uniref:F-box domain-containing protein n=1 Tax=Hypsizygus marmoreus TaxID=39966 RepID=A0A369J7P9_HYPMA|nr:hypothetical protein Hypma_002840 [Hypsizygus marmoreus]
MYELPNTEIGVSASSSYGARAAGYTRIEVEIDALKVAICAWKSRYNSLSIVSRLPPEILSAIFELNILCPGELNMDLVRASHVCSHWRSVALSSPGLWSRIPLTHQRWSQEMLARSKCWPLTIEGSLNSLDQTALYHVLGHLSRIRRVSLCEPLPPRPLFSIRIEDASPSFTLRAPTLESFVLHTASTLRLPDNLFGRDAPRLRHLDLANCSFSWNSPIFHKLTTLKLSRAHLDAQKTVEEVIFFLKRTTRLETLVLSAVLKPSSHDSSLLPEHIAHLPYLSHLQIDADYISCARLLNHLTHPATTHIKLVCESPMGTHGPLLLPLAMPHLNVAAFVHQGGFLPPTEVCETISEKARHVGSLALRRPLRASVGDSLCSLQIWPGSGLGWNSTTYSPPQLEFHMVQNGWHLNQYGQKVLEDVLCSLQLHDLESLSTENIPFGKDVWLNSFSQLKRLRDVRVKGDGGNPFLDALATGMPEINGNSEQSFSTGAQLGFRGLRSLVCDNWDFVGGGNRHGSNIDLFVDCLQKRHEHGVILDELLLKDCDGLMQEDVEAMCSFIPSVHGWDWESL